MPIDIPSDKSNPAVSSKATRSGNETSGTERSAPLETTEKIAPQSQKLSREQALQMIKAIVIEVNTKTSSIATSKQQYEATIQVNPKQTSSLVAPKSNSQPVVQLDARTLQRISQGQTLDIRVSTAAPLKVGHRLQVQMAGNGIRLLEIAPASLRGTLNHFIRHEINQQNSYTHLLAKLISLATTNNTDTPVTDGTTATKRSSAHLAPTAKGGLSPHFAASNPIATKQVTGSSSALITRLARDFIQSMPQAAQVSTAQGLKSAIKNSGLFYENNVTKVTSPSPTKTLNPAELTNQIKQQIKALQAALSFKPVAEQGASSPNSKPLQDLIQLDVKAKLLTLQQQLKQINQVSSSTDATRSTTKSADKPPSVATATTPSSKLSNQADQKLASTAHTTSVGATPTAPAIKNSLQKNLDDGDLLNPKNNTIEKPANSGRKHDQALHRESPLVYQKPTTNPVMRSSQAGAVQAPTVNTPTFSGSQPTPGSVKPGVDYSQMTLQPPLPGLFNVHAQSIRPQQINKESLADALISVLIKHTKEATSRLNLHQLASLADMTRMDSGPQQISLSFELPILQGNELALFQFRIHEEDSDHEDKKNNTAQEKKWVVHMGFDLAGLGAMYCQVTLVGVNADVTFWAEQSQTVAESQNHLKELRQNLSNLGVTVKEMQCIQGSPPTDQSGIKQTLIDIET
ncbi:MAG: flagellar hook-length control protein FliK [Pseudomonadales bacterium]|nr:flagellar hook-length control protein FliK [Pseudomonadales bacterium]